MNIKNIQEIPFKEKKALVTETCLLFNKLKKISEKSIIEEHRDNNHKLKYMNLRQLRGISIFETILELLNEEQKWIIINEFINKKTYAEQYSEKWSKTKYYKVKHQAIDNFLFLMFT